VGVLPRSARRVEGVGHQNHPPQMPVQTPKVKKNEMGRCTCDSDRSLASMRHGEVNMAHVIFIQHNNIVVAHPSILGFSNQH
jgi:hypothetical protein